jgi:hypothetical protein
MVSSDKCVVTKISQKARGVEKIKCNNHEIQQVECFKFFGIKIVPSESVKDGFTERVKRAGKFYQFVLWKWEMD